ncbi:hypothetical protein C6P45_002514 [Maudiozyma exigua]|uniref:Transcription initiation factor TFIID subunit 8 n=1 Tax=Maudiozyma exigua TaxID=34358 RepID=A0A9P6VVU5_MAUEX|nr:hypothetical protein C6P45_002514 [Kazachstania exigua]
MSNTVMMTATAMATTKNGQTKATKNNQDGNEDGNMISDLPNPEEIKHQVMEPELESIWLKALALQLKPMNNNTEMSRSGFELLSVLAMEQMDAMASELHRLTTIQRRHKPARTDVSLLLRGFQLNSSDLALTLEQNQYITKQFNSQSDMINRESRDFNEMRNKVKEDKLLNDTPFQMIEQEQIAALPLISSNNLQKYIPSWLPEFPPDHTYMFTPQYNNPTTNEVLIRIKATEEGRQSEKSLIGLLSNQQATKSETILSNIKTEEDKELDEMKHTESMYSPYTKKMISKRKHIKRKPLSTLTHVPKEFNVEEYAHKRIELARAKVIEYEMKQLKRRNDPFLNLTKLILQNGKTTNTLQVDKEVKSTLKKSFRRLLKNIPETRKEKAKAIDEARKRRELKLEELKKLQEKREKERKSDTAISKHLETILFETNFTANGTNKMNSLSADNDDDMGLFDTLDSSDDEGHPIDIKITVDEGETNDNEDEEANRSTIDGTLLPKETTTPSFNITSTQPVPKPHVTIREPTISKDTGDNDVDVDVAVSTVNNIVTASDTTTTVINPDTTTVVNSGNPVSESVDVTGANGSSSSVNIEPNKSTTVTQTDKATLETVQAASTNTTHITNVDQHNDTPSNEPSNTQEATSELNSTATSEPATAVVQSSTDDSITSETADTTNRVVETAPK